MEVVQCNPCPPLLPFGNQEVVMECGLSEPWLVEIHLLGMRFCGGCRWPRGKADQPALGASLHLRANPKAESTCSTGIWGSLCALSVSARVGQ